MRTVSLCITNWNRFDLLFESFRDVLQDERISEIVIVDDASQPEIFDKVFAFCQGIPKIRLYRNSTNQGCYRNKMISLSYAKNDFGIALDSDNIISSDYLDALYAIPEWDINTVYQPEWAMPHFNFTDLAGTVITKQNIAEVLNHRMGGTMVNAMNYCVHVRSYLEVFDYNFKEPWAADSIIQNYNWLNSGRSIFVVPGMHYQHRVHNGSHFREHQNKSLTLAKIFEDKLKQLK